MPHCPAATATARRLATAVALGGALLLLSILQAPVSAPAGAEERTVTYTVTTRGVVQSDPGYFGTVAREALTDPRGWSLGGTLAFRQVPSGSDFDLILASPSVIAAASPGCSATYSCRVGRSVYINDERWRLATPSWPHGLETYRRYVVLHEVGHWIGIPHIDCPAPGRTAWVMQQQSISLQGCAANMWPVIGEREQAGRLMGVSVAWSGVESRYRALGQERSVLGAPVTWELIAPDGAGRFQHYSRPGGASIYWHPWTGASEVYGAIRQRWSQVGWERGPVGYPVTGELAAPDGAGRFNHFAGSGGASIYWHPWTGASEVYGAIRQRWSQVGWERGPVGYPVTGELRTPDGVGRFNHFAGSGGASIYWTPQSGAHEVYGAIRQRWSQSGWERGPLGYPVSGEYDVAGGRRSDFQRGSITWDRASGATQVTVPG